MRSQCIVVRGNKVLLAKHRQYGLEYHCLPGGGIEPGEMPEQAALRELCEECNVCGTIVKKTSESANPYAGGYDYSFLVDIGCQEPSLGEDPEVVENPILVGIEWLALNEMCERDRAFLWAAGLIAVEVFAKELESWSDEISYPAK